jgi:transketolase
VGVDTFGASAPAPQIYAKFGITKEGVLAACQKVMA